MIVYEVVRFQVLPPRNLSFEGREAAWKIDDCGYGGRAENRSHYMSMAAEVQARPVAGTRAIKQLIGPEGREVSQHTAEIPASGASSDRCTPLQPDRAMRSPVERSLTHLFAARKGARHNALSISGGSPVLAVVPEALTSRYVDTTDAKALLRLVTSPTK